MNNFLNCKIQILKVSIDLKKIKKTSDLNKQASEFAEQIRKSRFDTTTNFFIVCNFITKHGGIISEDTIYEYCNNDGIGTTSIIMAKIPIDVVPLLKGLAQVELISYKE
jgi:hypothetical protein